MAAAAGLSFGEPLLLLGALVALLAIPVLVLRDRWKRRLADRFSSERLRELPMTAGKLRPWFAGLALAGFFLALASPFHGTTERPALASGARTVIAIDLSDSMNARDGGVSRFDFARSLARQVVAESDDRFGLVVFEGVAEVVSPLTTDAEAVGTLVDSLATGELPSAGSNLEAAINSARELLRSGSGGGRILLIGDGEETVGDWRKAADRAGQDGFHIDTILIGSESGSEIALADGSPLRDDKGEVVITRARPEMFQAIAAQTGGRFLANPATLSVLSSAGDSKSDDQRRAERIPNQRYQWPLAFAFCFAALASLVNRGAE